MLGKSPVILQSHIMISDDDGPMKQSVVRSPEWATYQEALYFRASGHDLLMYSGCALSFPAPICLALLISW